MIFLAGIELESKTIDDPAKCEKLASQPLQYVLGIDNGTYIQHISFFMILDYY